MKFDLRTLIASLPLFFTMIGFSQVTLADIDYISITDEININHERVTTLDFKIEFGKTIELWHTKQITPNEFHLKFFENKIHHEDYNEISRDSLVQLIQAERKLLDKGYQIYCDTVNPEFIKRLDSIVIVELLEAIQDPVLSKEDFLSMIGLKSNSEEAQERILEELKEFQNLTYFPLIGVTINLKTQEKIIFYCDSQSSIVSPWLFLEGNEKNYNPKINWALNKILPEGKNLNRGRLSSDFEDLKSKILEIANE